MHIIKLNAIDSTNSYLRELSSKKDLEDFTVVVSETQNKGRGQMGTIWESEEGKNLTCSVLKAHLNLKAEEAFSVSMITSLAIIKVLERFQIPRLSIKWPNDILSEDKKICGILIENFIKNRRVEASIIGIGLNVNQTIFQNLPQATSLKNITGQLFDISELMIHIISELKLGFKHVSNVQTDHIKLEYESRLFRRDKPSTFKDKKGQFFPGYIKGIDKTGKLLILLEDDVIKAFELKSIQLMF
ncbi:MAG: biotin--[acetyl-CoA-carboxylase] ligase [Bacteroidia bacterium]|nr:biotin--[acetyl-CoA-carboxylase] ligase [Bacteroidia bacterium]